MTPEGKVKKAGRAICDKLGIWHVAFQAGNGNKNGVPDDLLCVSGRFVAIEYKATEHQHPTQLQDYQLKKIRESGGVAVVINAQTLYLLEGLLSYMQRYPDGDLHLPEELL